jgi:hypothetical protein
MWLIPWDCRVLLWTLHFNGFFKLHLQDLHLNPKMLESWIDSKEAVPTSYLYLNITSTRAGKNNVSHICYIFIYPESDLPPGYLGIGSNIVPVCASHEQIPMRLQLPTTDWPFIVSQNRCRAKSYPRIASAWGEKPGQGDISIHVKQVFPGTNTHGITDSLQFSEETWWWRQQQLARCAMLGHASPFKYG